MFSNSKFNRRKTETARALEGNRVLFAIILGNIFDFMTDFLTKQ